MGYIFAAATTVNTQYYRGHPSYELHCDGRESDISQCISYIVENSKHPYCHRDIIITCTGKYNIRWQNNLSAIEVNVDMLGSNIHSPVL